MVQILPGSESFASQLGASLGGGLSQGMGQAANFLMQMAQEKAKIANQVKLYEQLKAKRQQPSAGTLGIQGLEDKSAKVGDQLRGQAASVQEDPYEFSSELEALGLHGQAQIEKSRAEQEQKHIYRVKEEEAKEQRARGNKLLEKRDQSRENILLRKADYNIAKESILQNPKDIGSMKNFMADTFNMPMLKTAPAAVFGGAMKDAYINTLQAVPGARLNQYLEKQIQSAMAKIGQSDEANLSALEIGQFKLDVEEMQNKILDELESEYEAKGQPFSGKASKELYKRLVPYVEERQAQLSYKLKDLQEQEIGDEQLRKNLLKDVPSGTFLTKRMAQFFLEKADGDEEKALKAAIRLGYKIPSDEFLEKTGY